ncbi:MAG: energy-coupling factor transporter transmembrane protein EcfT [Spirochaetaceae bacterium]|jgi:energy-coupling factor transport system permease protein|nr:energy-coupling factor transporter transmembrane protein EcfT [Spirochaetaceae bacterium]
MKFTLAYIERESPVHKLCGAVKFIVFLLWSILAMAGYDTLVMLVMTALGAVIFFISRIKIKETSFVFKMLLFFMGLNLITVYIFAPEQGTLVYGSRHIIFGDSGRWTLTQEQLFYEFNIFLKYCSIIPAAIVLIVTTNPSEFASSLNKIGAPPAVAYAVSLSLRYIPDVQRDYIHISQSQAARGVDVSRKAGFLKRIKGASAILLPLVFTSIERIDVISRAMELRGFGKHKKRTWYSGRPFNRVDFMVLAVSAALFIAGMILTFYDGDRFYNPFK